VKADVLLCHSSVLVVFRALNILGSMFRVLSRHGHSHFVLCRLKLKVLHSTLRGYLLRVCAIRTRTLIPLGSNDIFLEADRSQH
jgi:hypothetical protein